MKAAGGVSAGASARNAAGGTSAGMAALKTTNRLPIAAIVAAQRANVSATNPFSPLNLEPPGLVGGNRIEWVDGAKQSAQAMIDVIRGATQVIDVAMFIWGGSGNGKEVAEELIKKAKQGVEVNILIDQQGTPLIPFLKKTELFDRLRKAGARFVVNPRFTLKDGPQAVDHRKIVVADGARAVVSSANLTHHSGKWREASMLIDGPAATVAAAQMLSRWTEEGGTASTLQKMASTRLNHGPAQGKAAVALLANNPNSGLDATTYLMKAIDNAKTRIWIRTPFLTDPRVIAKLSDAAKRGIDVRVLVAQPNAWIGSRLLDVLHRSFYPRLLSAGVKVFEEPQMSHAKVQLIDDTIGVGSMNISERSLAEIHDVNAVTNDPDFVNEMADRLAADAAKSRLVPLSEKDSRLNRSLQWAQKRTGFRF